MEITIKIETSEQDNSLLQKYIESIKSERNEKIDAIFKALTFDGIKVK